MSNSLRPHELQHTRPPCPSITPRAYPNSCPLSWWCHPNISSSVVPFSSALNLSQHQGIFKWVNSSHEVAKALEFQLQHQSFQWSPRTDLLYFYLLLFFASEWCILFFFLLVGGKLLYNIVVGFVIHWHESAMDIHVFPIPITPPTSLSTWSLWVFPVHQVRALGSCIQPGLICFTLDNIHVSMLFSWNIPPSPSPTESKSLFYTSVSLFLISFRMDCLDLLQSKGLSRVFSNTTVQKHQFFGTQLPL